MYGITTINGKKYVERQIVLQQIVTIANATPFNSTLTLPGEADFQLKGLSQQSVAAGAAINSLFLFRLGNSDGNIWYHMGGVGTTQDRVLNTLTFGTAQFPFVWSPPIFYSKNASIKMEFESVSAVFPYTIYIGFHGSYLIPV